jgi:hypothetical protein
MSVLKLSTMWCMDQLRAKSISEADEEVNKLSVIEKIVLARKYTVSKWLIEGCENLARRDEPPNASERNRLGSELAFKIFELRERSWAWGDLQELGEAGARLDFDFQSTIHEIFYEELTQDKNYAGPPRKQDTPSSDQSD